MRLVAWCSKTLYRTFPTRYPIAVNTRKDCAVGRVTGIRIAKIWEDDTHTASATSGMAAVADQLKGFAPERGCSDRRERLFPRTKEIAGFPKRYDFSAEYAQRVFQQNR